MKKLRKYFRVVNIDVRIYRMTQTVSIDLAQVEYELQTKPLPDGKTRYFMHDQEKFVHSSDVFPKLNILKLLGKSGPAIGDCVTSPAYRGKSIYPLVINRVAAKLLDDGFKEVFILVNSDNISSIRGIEKAGFKLFATIKAKRFLLFYFDKTVKRFE